MSGQLLGFDWGALAERLKVRGIWNRDTERKLTLMENLMVDYAVQDKGEVPDAS